MIPIRYTVVLIAFLVLDMTGCDGCRESAKEKEALEWVRRGLAMERDGKMSDAADAYRRAILADARCRDAHFQLASLSERLGAFEQAEASYRKAIELQPDAAAYNNLGNVLGARGRLKDAIDAYREAAKREPGLASAHYNLGHSLILAHRFDEAEAELTSAWRLAPLESKYGESLGLFYKNNGEPERALPFLENCARMDSSRGDLLLGLADVYETLGRFDDAIRTLERHLPTVSDREKSGLLRLKIRELRMRRTDSKKRTLRS